MRFKSVLIVTTAATMALIGYTSARADDSMGGIETVVVTAEKRTENLQKAPVDVTVVSGDKLAEANVSEFSDLAKFAPSLTMTAGDHPGNSAAVIRGIGTFAFSVAVNPSVLVVVDDVAAGYQAQAFTDMVDLDSVEVLSGPQSTLYGKSASAGLVLIKTKAPTDTLTYFGDIKVTNDGEQRLALSVSGPLSDTVDYRVSGSYRNYGGNAFNIFTQKKINSDTAATLSGKTEWKPNQNFDAVFAAHYESDQSVCCGQIYTQVNSSPVAPLEFGLAGQTFAVVNAGITASPTNTKVALTQSPIANSSEYGLSVHLSYDFGDMSLLSITSLDHYQLHDLTDYDNTDVDIMGLETPCGTGAPVGNCNNTNTPYNTAIAVQPTQVHGAILQGGLFNVQTLAQEIRLASEGESTFNWLAGLYVDSEDDVRSFARGFQTYGAPVVPNLKADTEWRGEAQYQNYALFGQTEWEFNPGTTLITGLRLNREHSQYSYVDYYRVVSYPTFGNPAGYTNDVWTGKIGLQQQFTDDIMGFATISRGYKGVGYNLTSNLSAGEASNFPVKRETSRDYEIGTRTAWFDHRLVLNATAYWMDYRNFQVSSLAASPPAPANTFILTNIPAVRTRGVEVASTAAITDNLTLNANYAFTEAYAVNFPFGSCYAGENLVIGAPATCSLAAGPYQNLAGTQLPNAPKNKISAGVDWKVNLPGPANVDLNANTVWQSSENFGLMKDPGTLEPGYGITNLNVTFNDKDDNRFSLSFFVNNLFDKHYDDYLWNQGGILTYSGIAKNSQATAPEVLAHNIPRDYDRFIGFRFAFSNQ